MRLVALISFFVVSTTSLLPYNLFMNAHEYFYFKLHNVTSGNESFSVLEEETPFQRQFEGFLTLFGGIACIIGAALNLAFTTKCSNSFRVYLGHVIVLFSLLPTIVFTYIDTDAHQEDFFYMSLFLSSLASFGSLGLIGGGVMGLVSTFPPENMKAVMLGQSAGGVGAAILSIFCQFGTSDPVLNGRAYFLIATVWTVVSIFFYAFISYKASSNVIIDSQENASLLREDTNDGGYDDEDDAQDQQVQNAEKQLYSKAFHQSKYPLACIAITLIVSLSGFPAIASLVKSVSDHEPWADYFSSVCCFLAFNIGDACGRCLGTVIELSTKWLAIFSVSRLIFIPLIIFCNIEPRYYTPTLLPYDGIFLLIILSFGISHGHTFSMAINQVTSSVDADCGEVSGSIVNVACVISAFVGSFIGVGLVSLL